MRQSIAQAGFDNSEAAGFKVLSQVAYDAAGLVLTPAKKNLVSSRLRHRFAALKISSLNEYCSYILCEENQDERQLLISALTTNVTEFFREPHHFDILSDYVKNNILGKIPKNEAIRIWSAGCSTGQEPYSIAMHLLDTCPQITEYNFRILASDIDREVITYAKRGQYHKEDLRRVCPTREATYFYKVRNGSDIQRYSVTDNVRKLVCFKVLNLMDPWPMKRKLNAIFCRNVVIYFDQKMQEKLWARFAATLKPGAMVFVGHSERISQSHYLPRGATSYELRS